MADINYSRLTDLPFNKFAAAVITVDDYIYFIGGTSQGVQTLSGYSFKYSESEGWTVLSASGPVTFPRVIYYNGYFWMLGNGNWATATPDSIYRSSDCISWDYVGTLPGDSLNGYTVRLSLNYSWCIHNNRVYFTGYHNTVSYGGGSNAVVSTSDFVNFTIHRYHDQADGLGYPKRSRCGFYSIGGVLYVLGGNSETGTSVTRTDHWRSLDDGATWEIVDTDFDNNSLINNNLSTAGTGGSVHFKTQHLVGEDYHVLGQDYNFYTIDGVTFNQLTVSGVSNLGNFYNYVYFGNRFYIVGFDRNGSPYAYPYFYESDIVVYPSDAIVSFDLSLINSPSPAYLRFVDTSDIESLTSATDYLRIWQIFNNRTSASTFISATSETVDFVLEGLYGDTFNVSLSAVY